MREYYPGVTKPVMPPVMMADGSVCVIDETRVECFDSQTKKWEYLFPGFAGSSIHAAASANNKLVLCKGSRTVCLNENGEEEWSVLDETGETIVTAPVFTAQGKILCASAQNLIVIN
jgi:hypothetical protein